MKKLVLAVTDVNTDIGSIVEAADCGNWAEWGDSAPMQDKISILCKANLGSMGERAWDLL